MLTASDNELSTLKVYLLDSNSTLDTDAITDFFLGKAKGQVHCLISSLKQLGEVVQPLDIAQYAQQTKLLLIDNAHHILSSVTLTVGKV